MKATEWSARADARFEEALESSQCGDNYSLLPVLFAPVLFLTAMSQWHISELGSRIPRPRHRCAIIGVITTFTLPLLI